MKPIDKYLQNARFKKARKYIRRNDKVLDIGCAEGAMFEKWRGFIGYSVGIEPSLTGLIEKDLYKLIPGHFPEAVPTNSNFNVITMLAVLEHIPLRKQAILAANCFKYLKPNGRLIITVPSPQVDHLLKILSHLKLIDGMSLDEHYGFKPSETTQIFPGNYFKLLSQQKFQLGLNNLFVFEKND